MDRKFKVGDRIQRDSDGCTGTVTNINFYHSDVTPDAPYFVRVKWDKSNSLSNRVEDGLSLARKTA